jgi:hypothetical protein
MNWNILFSVNEFTANLNQNEINIIDAYFDSLLLNELDEPTTTINTIGNLFDMVDKSDKWMYKAYWNKADCHDQTLYNVLATVYPIK